MVYLFVSMLILQQTRWRRDPHPCSPARIVMKLITLRGIRLTQSYSALRARKIGGSCSGMQGVCSVLRNSDMTYPLSLFFITRKPTRPTIHAQGLSSPDQLRAGWRIIALCIIRKPALVHVLREGSRRSCSPSTVVSHGSCSGTSPLSFTLPTECDLITIGVLVADCVGRDV
jgi:hypothetical protein